MDKILGYFHGSYRRECVAFLILSFSLTWVVWVPVLIASRTQGDALALLGLGVYGPAAAALVVSYRGNRIQGCKLGPRLICFGVTLLLCWFVLVLHARLWEETHLSLRMKSLMLLPAAIPAWVVSAALSRDGGVRATMRSLLPRGRFVWHGVALLLFPTLLLATGLIAQIPGGSLHRPVVPRAGLSLTLLIIVEFGYSFFFGGGVTEEPGWRGFLLPRLQERFSPLSASVLAWLPWALWHVPLDSVGYAGETVTAYLRSRVLILIPLSIIMTWLYNRCGGTILSAALFHASFNVSLDYVPSTNRAGWAIAALAVVVIGMDKMWRKTTPTSATARE